MITIDKERAIELLTAAVAERGEDFRYQPGAESGGHTCEYERKGEPSCGVGLALFNAGLDVTQLEILDTLDDSKIDSSEVRQALTKMEVAITNAAFNILAAFQFEQDRVASYGAALTIAKSA